jgi:hypothetical protein
MSATAGYDQYLWGSKCFENLQEFCVDEMTDFVIINEITEKVIDIFLVHHEKICHYFIVLF